MFVAPGQTIAHRFQTDEMCCTQPMTGIGDAEYTRALTLQLLKLTHVTEIGLFSCASRYLDESTWQAVTTKDNRARQAMPATLTPQGKNWYSLRVTS